MKRITVLLMISSVLYLPTWAQGSQAYQSSAAPAQPCADGLVLADPNNPDRYEITQASALKDRVNLRVPSVLSAYVTQTSRRKFDDYWKTDLKPWLRKKEKAGRPCLYGDFPVAIARIGELVFELSTQQFAATGWPDGTQLKGIFEPISEKNMKQFGASSAKLKSYRQQSLTSYETATEPQDNSDKPTYGITINLHAPCSITFYQLQSPDAAAFDKAFESKMAEWSVAAKEANVTNCPLTATRIADVLFLVASAENAETFEKEVILNLLGYIKPQLAGVIRDRYPATANTASSK